MDTAKWCVVPSGVSEQWGTVFLAAFRECRGIRLGEACPHCGIVALRQFYIRHQFVDPESLSGEPAWMRERVARLVDAADGLEWCANCRIYDDIKDKSAPSWWPDSVAGVERGSAYEVEGVIDVVTVYLAEHGDFQGA
ncbi:hypothetical protein [Umezawaea sp. NPDC059074]|uniref:hypothetical protein n=1 Tax=Umezawaea sp. NPDC059074 TaxID=3346716 RepID=UPI0036A6BFBA